MESEQDEEFVCRLGIQYGVGTRVKRFETEQYARDNRLSIQMAARELRYLWFNAILNGEWSETLTQESRLQTPGAQLPTHILTAHHADDNLETMLMNFFKGTGIAGLRAMQTKQGRLVRPLLFARKGELVKYAEENKLIYREDSSNTSIKYTRNYVRNELMPVIRKIFPGVEDNLVNNLTRFEEIEQLYHEAVDKHKRNIMELKGKEVYIPVLKLRKMLPRQTVMYEIAKDYGFTPHQATEAIALLDSDSGKYVQSIDYRIIKHRTWLIISPRQDAQSQNILIENNKAVIIFALGKLECTLLPFNNKQISASADIAQLDAADITFPLLLRKRKQGDYFYPLGMQKKRSSVVS